MRNKYVLWSLVGTLAFTLTICFQVAAELDFPRNVREVQSAIAVISAEIEKGSLKRAALNQDYLVMHDSKGEQYRLPIAFTKRQYVVKTLHLKEGKSVQFDLPITSYEIASVDKDIPFNWNLCSGLPLGMFRLLSNARGENYFTWVHGATVCFTKVAEARDCLAALTDEVRTYDGTPPQIEVIMVPTGDLIPREYRSSPDGPFSSFYYGFLVEALDVRAADDMTITVKAPGREEPFTFHFDGKEWREAEATVE